MYVLKTSIFQLSIISRNEYYRKRAQVVTGFDVFLMILFFYSFLLESFLGYLKKVCWYKAILTWVNILATLPTSDRHCKTQTSLFYTNSTHKKEQRNNLSLTVLTSLELLSNSWQVPKLKIYLLRLANGEIAFAHIHPPTVTWNQVFTEDFINWTQLPPSAW